MWVTEKDTASLIIIGRKANLFFSESNFESVSKSFEKFSVSITAAAVTGPAIHPLPASSVPASIQFSKK